jgi:hypothetical protein
MNKNMDRNATSTTIVTPFGSYIPENGTNKDEQDVYQKFKIINERENQVRHAHLPTDGGKKPTIKTKTKR